MYRFLALVFALIVSVAVAADRPASEASIREMLQITEVRKLVDGVLGQVDGMMKASMQQALKGHVPTPEEQIAMDKMRDKAKAMIQEELGWEKLEPMYLAIYQKSLSQAEVDGMIAFYKSPAGAAMIKKLPLIMQETMTAMQAKMGPIMERLRLMAKQTLEELQAAKAKKG